MTPVVRVLIVANIAAFVLQMAYPLVEYVGVFIPQLALERPWTFVTYMFLHARGFAHIGFNMLGLFFFGPRVEDRMGSRRFMIMYFLSGITGAALSMLLSPAPMIGASAGVFGVMLCFAHYWPNDPIHIWGIVPVPARLLIIFTTIVAIWSGRSGGGNIAHWAHLGGYLGAFLFLRWIERGRREFKQKVVAVPAPAQQKLEDWKKIDLSTIHAINREEVQRLLEKIAKDGIGALTAQERLFLSNFVPLGGSAGAPPS